MDNANHSQKIPYDLLGLSEIAQYAHVTRQAIWFAIHRGHLKAEKIKEIWCANKALVDDYLAQKYNREEKRKDCMGKKVFEISRGIYSVNAAEKYLSTQLGRKFGTQRLYYLIHQGRIPAYKERAAWVLKVEDLEKLVRMEKELEMAVK